MGQGAFINIKNSTTRPVSVGVSNVNNMGNGASPSVLGVLLPPGGAVPGPSAGNGGNFYLESSGFDTSTFNLTFIYDDNQEVIGHINFTEDSNAYSLADNDNPGVLMCSWFNQYPPEQSYISIAVLPFTLNWTTWMSGWPDLSAVQLGQLCLPGTHDSGTYMMQQGNQDSGSFEGQIGSTLNGIVETQTQTVGQQLFYGARYFDLRPGGLLSNPDLFQNPLFHVHSPNTGTVIACAPMPDILNDIRSFAKANPKELIILNFSHLTTAATNTFTFTNPCNNQQIQNASPAYALKFLAAEQIFVMLFTVMLPPIPITTTLSEIWEQHGGRNVICLIDCTDNITFGDGNGQIELTPIFSEPPPPNFPYNLSAADLFWQITNDTPYLSGWNNYANVDNYFDLLNWLSGQFDPSGNYTAALPGTINVLQCQLTPQTGDVIGDATIDPYNNVSAAQISNPAVQAKFGIHIAPGALGAQGFAKSVNVFLTDAFDGTAVNWAVASNLYRLNQP